MLNYLLLILFSVAFATWILFGVNSGSDRFQRCLPMAVGGGMVLISFTSMPWVQLAPFGYSAHLAPHWMKDVLPDILSLAGTLLGWPGVSRLVAFFSSIGSIPGWLLVFLIPARAFLLRSVLLLVFLAGLTGSMWFLFLLFIRRKRVQQVGNLVVAVFSLLAAALLLIQMPVINSWGARGSHIHDFVVYVSGARMGFGVWVAWVGLLFLAMGGFLGTFSTKEQSHPGDKGLLGDDYA